MVRKGQTGSNAGITIIVVVVLMILYLLFLPPGDRQTILEGGVPTGMHNTNGNDDGTYTSSGTLQKYLLRENVGNVYEQDKDEITINLLTANIGTNTQAQIIKQKNVVYIKNSAFQDIKDSMTFELDSDLAENLILSFNSEKGEGTLQVAINGETIYRGELKNKNSPPIYIEKEQLKGINEITFEVDNPGIIFWRYNEYLLSDVKIIADVTDVTNSKNEQTFSIKEADYEQIDTARLKYIPVCKEYEIQNMEIILNNQRIFKGIPDCNAHNFIAISKTQVKSGINELEFNVEKGTLLADRPELQLKFSEPEYPIYYFELNDKYFDTQTKEKQCGDIDGQCPSGCTEDEDKDCCFKRSSNYWCDTDTNNFNDRCISFVADCDRCEAGYEDRSGDAPDRCVDEYEDTGYCGDDDDDYCPTGCSKYYDKDCCFEDGPNYWCEDVPRQGLESVCEAEIDANECDDCIYGYKDEDGDKPSCNLNTITDEDEQLSEMYDIKYEMTFPNNDKKELNIWINGKKFGINTLEEKYDRLIDEYVKSGSNSIEIRPEKDATITELVVKLLR
ncbi:hypothetical protein K9L67_01625 [Candidatus Woesearchaeota archaeon]|nr:hypothetical protein [Candidatus Woesearchaeota archaeon]MCF7900903.1 hypothetical protein [Candidatus Woesearchaeota archaeon]MCF8013048.1 hypothetical protein [Candidatus Woesearchaeota archaeon]